MFFYATTGEHGVTTLYYTQVNLNLYLAKCENSIHMFMKVYLLFSKNRVKSGRTKSRVRSETVILSLSSLARTHARSSRDSSVPRTLHDLL